MMMRTIIKLMRSNWLPASAFMLLPGLLWAGTMQIEAEKMIFFHKENKVEFISKVQVKRDDFMMNCDRLLVHYSEGKTSKLEFVDAFGHVSMIQGERKGYADTARLDQKKDTLTLTGNAVLEQPGGRIEGETIIHHMSSEKTEVHPVKGGRTHMTIETGDKGNALLPGTGK